MLQPVAQTTLTANPAAPQPRLVRAAHEFEAQLMKELLKPLTASDGLTGPDEESGSAGALGDYAGESLARALSDQGGFGIANRIVAQVAPGNSQSGNRPAVAPVTANQHANTGLNTHK